MSCYAVEGVFESLPIQSGMRVEPGGHWHEHNERKEIEKQVMEILDSTWKYHEIMIRHIINKRIGCLK